METKFKVAITAQDARYSGGLVAGAKMLELFGDAATELLIRYDGDEGLLRAYSSVEFLAPVTSGDFIEIKAKITKIGNTSRQMEFEAWKVVSAVSGDDSAAEELAKPLLVCKASGTCVTPKDKQRKEHG